jgi:ABC-type uncharacterized transport system permease subunit
LRLRETAMLRLYTFGAIVAIAIAWFAALVHRSGHAPIGLVSIGVGVTLGLALGSIAATLRVAGRRRLLITTILFVLVAVIAQHAWLYADFRREWREGRRNSPQVAMFRDESPWTLWEYLKHEATPQRVALWCMDAALIMTSALGSVWMLGRRAQLDSAWRPTPTTHIPDT